MGTNSQRKLKVDKKFGLAVIVSKKDFLESYIEDAWKKSSLQMAWQTTGQSN